MSVADLYNIRWCCAEITPYCAQMSRFYFDRCTDDDNAIVITYYSDKSKTSVLRSFTNTGPIDAIITEPDEEASLLADIIVNDLVRSTSVISTIKYTKSSNEGRIELIFYRSGLIDVIPNPDKSINQDLATVLGRLKLNTPF